MLEDRAKELGRLIGQSPEYVAVKRANESLNADAEAVAVLRQMEQIRRDAQLMLERGEQPTAEMEQQLDALLGKVQESPVYQGVLVAQPFAKDDSKTVAQALSAAGLTATGFIRWRLGTA